MKSTIFIVYSLTIAIGLIKYRVSIRFEYGSNGWRIILTDHETGSSDAVYSSDDIWLVDSYFFVSFDLVSALGARKWAD